MKKLLYILVFTSLTGTFFQCSKAEGTPENIEIHDFIWKGMNAYYLWQGEIPNLSDTRFTTQSQLNSFLEGFSSPTDFFKSLLFEEGTTDRFSWIVDDYVALEQAFQGITLNNGMEFGLVRYENGSDDVFGYVRYVIPDSDAAIKGVKRGDIFSKINDTQITASNYRELIGLDSYTIELADYDMGNPTANGTTYSLDKAQIQENPIAISKVIDEGGKKIGYLMYNQFASSYDSELNDVFAQFKNENITDLIIDLRYNGGGSVATCTYLGSMITGQFNGQMFSQQRWNDKIMAVIDNSRFINNFPTQIESGSNNITINSLQLTNVTFIVSKGTASASELIINALNPYINVTVIGDTTYGKHVGSITLYDSDDFRRDGDRLNTNHSFAMQPITFEIQNKLGQNAPTGFIPDIQLKEDYGDLGELGEKSDPLLDRAIQFITTGARNNLYFRKNNVILEEIGNSKQELPNYNSMYLDFY